MMKWLLFFISTLCIAQSQNSGSISPTKFCVQLWGEDSDNLANGRGDYSLGNGNEIATLGNWGHYAHYDGEIISYAINKRTNASGNITVALTVDGNQVQNLILPSGSNEVKQNVSIAVAEGQVVNWQTVSTPTGQNDVVVSAILCYEMDDYSCNPCCNNEEVIECENFNDIIANRPLTNTGWNNELETSGQLHSGDIEFCFTVDNCTSNTPQMIGLNSDISVNASYASIDYAFYLYKAGDSNIFRVYIYENATYRGLFVNQITPYTGSELCIRKVGTTVTYYMDGNLLYTSTVASNDDLGMDNSFYSTNTGFWSTGEITLSNTSICPYTSTQAISSRTTSKGIIQDDDTANPKNLK